MTPEMLGFFNPQEMAGEPKKLEGRQQTQNMTYQCGKNTNQQPDIRPFGDDSTY